MTHTAKTHWSGSIKDGKGTLSSQSGVLENTNFSYYSRGSLYETKTWLVKAHNRKQVSHEDFEIFISWGSFCLDTKPPHGRVRIGRRSIMTGFNGIRTCLMVHQGRQSSQIVI